MKNIKHALTNYFFISALMLFSQLTFGQGVDWAKFISGGTNFAPIHSYGTTVANNGDVYVVGKFEGAGAIGSTNLVGVNDEGFIARFSSIGNLIWVKTIGGSGDDVILDVAVDNNGGVYFCGYYESAATFGSTTIPTTGSTSFNQFENFLAKYDTSGNEVWIKHGTKRRAQSGNFNGNSKVEVRNGSIYYLSNYEYRSSTSLSADKNFDATVLPVPNGSSFISTSVFIARYSFTGTKNWVKSIISDASSFSETVISDDITVKGNGHVVIQGNARSGLSIGTTTILNTDPQMVFVVELDTSGLYSDSYKLTNSAISSRRSYGITVDSLDQVYFVGSNNNGNTTSVAGASLPSTGTYVIKLSDNLNPVGASSITSSNSFNSGVYCVSMGNNGNLVLGGVLNGMVLIGSESFSATRRCFFTSVDSSFSTINWVVKAENLSTTGGFIGNNIVSDCEVGPNNEFVFSGYLDLSNTSIGDYFSPSTSTNDGFVTKIVECYPQIATVTPANPVICGSGGGVTLNGNFNSQSNVNWLSSGIKINGASSGTYFVNNPGDYSIIVDSLGCKDTSNVVTVTLGNLPQVTAPSNTLSICSTSGQVVIPSGSPAGGVWSGTGVVNDTIFDPSISGSGPSLITYTFTNPQGCSASAVQIANVIVPPTLSITSNLPSFCENDAVYGLGSIVFPLGGAYSGQGVSANSFDPSVAGVGTHRIVYTYSAGIGCTDSLAFNLVVNPSPTISFPSFNPICNSVFSTPLGSALPTGGTYTGNFIISNNFYPFLSGAGSYPITYTVTQNGCTSTKTQNIKVDEPISTSLNTIGPFCLDDAIHTLTEGSPSGGVYLVNGAVDTVVNPMSLGAGTHQLEYAFTNACGTDTSTISFVVNDLPVVSLVTVNPLCENENTIALNQGSPSSGVYSGTFVNNGNFNPAVAGVGSSVVYYTYTDGNGCVNLDSTTVTVNAKPYPMLTADSLVCLDNGLTSISSSISGGAWAGTGVSGSSFDPLAAGVGVHSLTHTVTNLAGCTDTSSINIEVKPLPVVSLASFAPICNSSSSAIPLNGGMPLNGVYSGIGVSNGFFNPSTSGSGFHLVTYTYTDTFGCSMFDTATMTVDTSTVAVSLASMSDVCLNGGPVSLSGGLPAGGFFSGNGVNSGVFDPQLVGAGMASVYYSYTAPNACVATATQSFNVDTIPVVGFDSIADQCVDAVSFNLSTGWPNGGNYTGAGVLSGVFTPSAAGVGTSTLMYSYTDGNGCSNSANREVKVNPLPGISLNVNSGICYDSGVVVLTGGLPIGGTYSGVGVNNGEIDPVIAGSGRHAITYTYVDSNGCENFAIDSIDVYQPVATLNAFNDLCADASPIVLSGGAPNGGAYSGVGVANGDFSASVSGVGTFDIIYTIVENGCTAVDTQSITVNALPMVFSSGFPDACESDTSYSLQSGIPVGGVYSGLGVSNNNFNPSVAGIGFNHLTYTVTDTFGCANSVLDSVRVNANPIVSLAPFSSICENAPVITLAGGLPSTGTYSGNGVINGMFNPMLAGAGSHEITFADTNSFGCSSSTSDTIVVHSLPSVSLSPIAAMCINATTLNLTGGAPSGGVYSGTGVSNGSFSPMVSGAGTFDVIYTYIDVNQCVVSDTEQVVVNSLPIVGLPIISAMCENDTAIALQGGTPVGGVYSGTGVANGDFDPTVAGSGTHLVTYTFTDLNGCVNDSTISIQVNGAPVVSLTAFNDVCEDTPIFSLTGGAPTGGVYSGNGVANGDFDPVIAGLNAHLITYSYTNGNGCTEEDTASIMVNALPVVTNALDDTLCINSPVVTLTSGMPIGGVYSGLGVSNGNFDPTNSGAGIIDVVYSYSDVNGCSNSDSGLITVGDLPTIDAGNDLGVCEGNTAILTASGGDSYLWNTGSTTDTTMINPTMDGWFFVDGWNVLGCQNSDSIYVTMNPNPVVDLGSIDSLCMDSIITLDAGSGQGIFNYAWSTGANTQTIDVGPFTSVQTVSFYVTVADTNFCFGSDTVTFDIVDCGPNSIVDLEDGISIELYPNPNNGVFNLNLKDWKNSTAEVHFISNTGALIFTKNLSTVNGVAKHQFDMSGFANGLYWLIIKGDQKIYRKQVMINK